MDNKLRQLERNYHNNASDENWKRLTAERNRCGLLNALAMVNGFGYNVPADATSFAKLQPYIPFKLAQDDHIDLHYLGMVTHITWRDPYGHLFVRDDEPIEGNSDPRVKGKLGWYCKGCTLWVMTEGEYPSDAPRVWISCGSFEPHFWRHWTCQVYLRRVLGAAE